MEHFRHFQRQPATRWTRPPRQIYHVLQLEEGEQRPRPVGATIKLLKSIVEGEGDRARGKWNVSRTFLAYEMSTRCSFFSGRERRRIWILGCMLMQPCTRFQNCIFPSLDRISLEIYRSGRNSRRNSLGIYD